MVADVSAPSDRLVAWLAGGRRGVSSNTIVQHLTGLPALGGARPCHPWDPSDLARCLLLIEAVPELEDQLPRMAELSPQWAQLVAHWDELATTLEAESPDWRRGRGEAPRTYRRMKELLNDASGGVRPT